MWCSSCQQDVPAAAQHGRRVCSRCQQPLPGIRPPHAARICDDGLALDEPVAARAAAAPPLGELERQSRDKVRQLSRQLRRPGARHVPPSEQFRPFPNRTNSPQIAPQFELPQFNFDAHQVAVVSPLMASASTYRRRPTEAGQVIAWLVVAAGVIALGCGLGGLAWSLSAAQTEYWNAALGLTLGGQGLLIFGLVLVVTRLWRNSRYASGKLQEVTSQLVELQRTADALTAMRGSGAPAFYADLVRGASPHVLLANLKGQLDQLATRIASGW